MAGEAATWGTVYGSAVVLGIANSLAAVGFALAWFRLAGCL